MALSQDIIDLIRDEIGIDTDFVDNDSELTGGEEELGSLESVYTSANRGNFNILRTALIVWRRRLASHQGRAFDVTKEGAWLARSQRSRFLRAKVAEYERLVSDKPKSRNAEILSAARYFASDPEYD